jgi:ribosomal protein L10
VVPSQVVLEEKSGEVEAIKGILQGYKSIGICSLKKVRASQLQGMKKNFAGKVYMRVFEKIHW